MNLYSIVIPTILPQRQHELAKLLIQLAQLSLNAPIVISPHHDGVSTRTDCVRALERGAAFGCPWTLYLEDDAFLAPVFDKEVTRILRQAVEVGCILASFYSDAQRTVCAMQEGVRSLIIEPRHFWSTVCVAVLTREIPSIAEYAPMWYSQHPQHWHASDLLLAAYCALRKSRILVCVPSPVQHRDPPSTLGHPVHRKRQSRTFRTAYGEVMD